MTTAVIRPWFVATIMLVSLPATATAARKPNIIVIYTDDHGYSDIACQSIRKDLKTPHMDSLAKGGVRMTDGYVTAPQCVPSRAGLLTGRYQNRFGVESNKQFKAPGGLDSFNRLQTISERLKRSGYVTGMAGKWHLGSGNEIPRHGFDKVFNKNGGRPAVTNFDLNGNDVPLRRRNIEMYHLDACTAAACSFIERFRDRPFFFYLAYRAPHVPLDPPRKYLDRFPGKMPERRRKALAMISALDDGVGRILATLRKHKLEERTLIFLISDNGAPLKIHKDDAPGGGPGWDGSLNDPLNGEKGMLSEGGIRVPFLVYWKGTLPAGKVYGRPVISLDVAATAIAVAGLQRDPKLDGVNLIPFLRGEKRGAPHETLYWRWIAQAAVREGKWKYLQGGSRRYLFDLEKDRGEKRNLIKTHPEVAKRLRSQLKRWAAELKPAGLNGRMAATWNAYFDYYLDGKPAPPLRKRRAKKRPNRRAIFQRRDRNGDGLLTLKELIGDPAKRNVKALTRQFKRLDKSGDGKLTLEEFLRRPDRQSPKTLDNEFQRGKPLR
jgi:arylsulfatase A-like enzyme